MPTDLAIRDLKPADVEQIVEIALAAWEPIFVSFRGIMGEELFAALHPDWREDKARQVRSACDPGGRARVCVAEKGEETVGFITFHVNDKSRVAEIGNNAVHPDHQGQGIGTEMYQYIFEKMREAGMRFVKVSTGGDPSHAPARRAYEKAGFSISVPSVDYYREL